MNLTAAQAELAARGFDYLSDARKLYLLNQARSQFEDYANWPWVEATKTPQAAPIAISDFKDVLTVVDQTQRRKLEYVDYRTLTDWFPVLDQVGAPQFYWLDTLSQSGSGTTTVRVYPLNTTNTIAVRYVWYSPDLSAGADLPVHPSRYDGIWIDLAVLLAYEDSDDAEQYAQLKAQVDAKLAAAAAASLDRQDDDTEYVVVGGSSTDWGC